MGQGNKTAWTATTSKNLQSILCSGCTGTLQTLPGAFLLSFQLFSRQHSSLAKNSLDPRTAVQPVFSLRDESQPIMMLHQRGKLVNPGICSSPYPYRTYLDDITRSCKSICFVLGGLKRAIHLAKMEPDRPELSRNKNDHEDCAIYKDWRMTNMHSTMHPSSEKGVTPLKDSMVEGFLQHSMNRIVLPFIWNLDTHTIPWKHLSVTRHETWHPPHIPRLVPIFQNSLPASSFRADTFLYFSCDWIQIIQQDSLQNRNILSWRVGVTVLQKDHIEHKLNRPTSKLHGLKFQSWYAQDCYCKYTFDTLQKQC